MAKEFLSRNGVPMKVYDIRADPEAMNRLVNQYKSRATPTIVIDGEVIVGFSQNRERVKELLGI